MDPGARDADKAGACPDPRRVGGSLEGGSSTGADEPGVVTLIARLRGLGASVGTAESVTGGLVAARLTSIPGSSAVVRGAVVAYATDVKVDLLAVDPGLLARTGPVHPEVAMQMAQGARAALGAVYAVATTGEAGPESASGQPVGSAWVAVCGPRGCSCSQVRARGDRHQVREAIAGEALRCLAEVLDVDAGVGRRPSPSGPRPAP